jgi:anti-sigma regulatory factor (Ser/Thr protein kinase)
METINIGARFAPTSASVPAARRFVLEHTDLLDGDDLAEITAVVALLVSELATNAVIHARTPFRVTVRVAGAVLRVEIEDQDPSLPQPRPSAAQATTGRGLLIVDRLADRWGATRTDAGKQVWFERAITRPSSSDRRLETSSAGTPAGPR